MKNYLKGINQRLGNIFINVRTLEELEKKTKSVVNEEENVFDKKYYRYKNGDSYIPEAERTYYVGVSYNF